MSDEWEKAINYKVIEIEQRIEKLEIEKINIETIESLNKRIRVLEQKQDADSQAYNLVLKIIEEQTKLSRKFETFEQRLGDDEILKEFKLLQDQINTLMKLGGSQDEIEDLLVQAMEKGKKEAYKDEIKKLEEVLEEFLKFKISICEKSNQQIAGEIIEKDNELLKKLKGGSHSKNINVMTYIDPKYIEKKKVIEKLNEPLDLLINQCDIMRKAKQRIPEWIYKLDTFLITLINDLKEEIY